MSRSKVVSRIITASALLALVAISAAGRGDSPTDATPTDINWDATPKPFRGQNNARLRFNCPPNGSARRVWGVDVYTDDSSICTAAVHAGGITLAGGGLVTIEIRPGQADYRGTTRNGITSFDYDAWDGSFIVR
ncbi:MAG: LCCL domain-containing protein [Gemmatimonadota bacterium]